MKNKRFNEGGSQQIEQRTKRKSCIETVALLECVFCVEKESGCTWRYYSIA